jgi:hypothetical protein
VISPQADGRDHDREDGEHERKSAVKAARLRADPGVEEANDLSPLVRVGAAVLRGTGVADVRLPPVADQAALVVVLEGPEMLPLRALPGIQVRV